MQISTFEIIIFCFIVAVAIKLAINLWYERHPKLFPLLTPEQIMKRDQKRRSLISAATYIGVALLFGLLLILPKVYLVTEDVAVTQSVDDENLSSNDMPDSLSYFRSLRMGINFDDFYVPFYFHGKGYYPFGNYLVNETPYCLGLYRAAYVRSFKSYQGSMGELISVKPITEYAPESSNAINVSIGHEFTDLASSVYLGSDKSRVMTTRKEEIYLDFAYIANRETQKIYNPLGREIKIPSVDEIIALDTTIKHKTEIIPVAPVEDVRQADTSVKHNVHRNIADSTKRFIPFNITDSTVNRLIDEADLEWLRKQTSTMHADTL